MLSSFLVFRNKNQELVLFWENVCTEQPEDIQDIIKQSIWNNKFILREGDSIFYPSLHGKGLLFIRDLLEETGSFLNWSIVKEKFSLANEDYMSWMSVIQSIPTYWQKEIAVISSYMNTPNYSPSHISARSMYTKLIQPLFKPLTSQKTTEKLLSQLETVVPDTS